ncbi:DUF1501 domain-containing protein [Kineosporia sp. A_224]|uniref:DUF1501 domain-containing protein n=1 Tax=Kineosporia sp. A_224 TaxID=1962180 RepID=UPI000B4C0B93|nr:DUF1501 domain-containing protein [Kineosporia sp. A_224]
MDTGFLDRLPSDTPGHDERPDGFHDGCDCGTQAPADDPWRKGFTRRRLFQGSTAMVAALGLQTVSTRYAYAAATDTDTIVVINARGGMDGLNVVVPVTEQRYYALRRNIAVPEGAALPLASGFGLHPAMPKLHKRFQAGQFAPVVAVGTPDRTLSHFEAMDTLERGTAAGNNTSGWMNRVLTARSQTGVFSAVQFGNQLPLSLTGPAPALAMDGIQSFGLAGYDDVRAKAATAFAALYKGVDHPMATQASRTLKAVGTVDTMRATSYTPANGAVYPDGGLGNTLEDLARIIKAKVGLSLATIDIGGWDMHTNEGRVDGGDLRNHLVDLDNALDAFAADLGDGFGDVTVVVLSEFGRTVRENGTVGTDHGHGQVVWVLGGAVNGGRIYGTWPGLTDAAMFTNGSLAATTDYRDVLGDVLAARGGVSSFAKVFPDHTPTPLGIVKPRA